MNALRAVALLAAVWSAGAAAEAKAEDAQPESAVPCNVLRLHPAGVLQQCGERLRSMFLSINDMRRQPSIDASGVFSFVCPLEAMCVDEPQINGRLIDPRRWTKSSQDEQAIFEIIQRPPGNNSPWQQNPLPVTAHPDSVCKIFDVSVAGMNGRGVCYRSEQPKSSTVVVVVADINLGYLLLFHRADAEVEVLREKVLTMLPRFRMEIANGDLGLLMWIR